jgi:dihydrofolate reductase
LTGEPLSPEVTLRPPNIWREGILVGKLIVTEFISLDGVIEDPGGAEGEWGWTDFEHSGWSFEFDRGEEGDNFKLEELKAADVQLLGRITYEGFAKAWPPMRTEAGEFGEKMNAMPKYVVSTTMSDQDAMWENSTVIRDDLPGEIARLKKEVADDILVQGSATLVQSLTEDGLADQYRLMVFPIVLGTGKRLFEGRVPKTKLRLDTKPVGPDGVFVLTYEHAD